MKRTLAVCLVVVRLGSFENTWGRDWPTYMGDNRRSGVSSQSLKLPLTEIWVRPSETPPQPAWPGPARQDYWHHLSDLRSTLDFDRAFQIVGVGKAVYFGSSGDDRIHAVDARTGRTRWTYCTEGPIRFAPVISDARVYAGSDDGCVYCLSAGDGSLIWKRRIAPDHRMIPGNGRMISLWPVRTGLVVDDGFVYCSAGLFPQQGAYLAALDARMGESKYTRKIDISPQGYLLASTDRLYVPTGRTHPVIFSREEGKVLGALSSAGGAYALLTEDTLVAGPGRGAKQLQVSDLNTKDTVATFGGLRIVVNGPMAYMLSEQEVTALNRREYLQLAGENVQLSARYKALVEKAKQAAEGSDQAKRLAEELNQARTRAAEIRSQMEKCTLWTIESDCPHAMILAGDLLILGGDGKVVALNPDGGDRAWTAPVEGRAYGLSVVDEALFVSTDRGSIHCFGEAGRSPVESAPQVPENLRPARWHRDAIRLIASRTGFNRGYYLVVGSGQPAFVGELRKSGSNVVVADTDADRIARAREALGPSAGVAYHQVGSLNDLPYTDYFANLIVVGRAFLGEGAIPGAENLYHHLRPYGGLLVRVEPDGSGDRGQIRRWGGKLSGWQVESANGLVCGHTARGPLEGAGEWTHTYGEPGNTACSGDDQVKGEMTLQWFGRPGPRRMIDRHHRNVPPLFKDGRLFVPGDAIVFAVDAYNGAIQWQVEVPNSRRLGVFLDFSNMSVDEDQLYIAAEDKCYGFNVDNGTTSKTYTVPQPADGPKLNWGYVAQTGDVLFGSGCKPGASYQETSYAADSALWYRNMKLVTSDSLFALAKADGEPLWTYRKSVILNTTITLGRGRIYFVETNSPKALSDKTGRMPVKTLFDGGVQALVALDAKTGDELLRQELDVSEFEEPVYLSYADDVLLLSGSRLLNNRVRYHYEAFDAVSGSPLWSTSHDTSLATDGGHGEYNRHPTIVGDTVYAWPYAYKLKTGERIEGWQFSRQGHGCGGISASQHCLFWRGANPWMYNLGPGGGFSRLNSVSRLGCWINVIPAGGLVLIPEASSGCTCGFPIQTSMAYIPKAALD